MSTDNTYLAIFLRPQEGMGRPSRCGAAGKATEVPEAPAVPRLAELIRQSVPA